MLDEFGGAEVGQPAADGPQQEPIEEVGEAIARNVPWARILETKRVARSAANSSNGARPYRAIVCSKLSPQRVR